MQKPEGLQEKERLYLVMRARGSVVCVGVRDAEKGPRAKCPPRAE